MLPSTLTFPSPVWDDSVNASYLEGRRALEEGHVDLAITAFRAAEKQLAPSHPSLFLLDFFLGYSFLQKKQTIRHYQSLGHVTRPGFYYHTAITIECEVPYYGEALKHLQNSLELNHFFVPAQFLRGQSNETAGNIALAFQDYLSSWIRDPQCSLYLQYTSRLFSENPSLSFNLGSALTSSHETLYKWVQEGKSAFIRYYALQELILVAKGARFTKEERVSLRSTLESISGRKVFSSIPIPFFGDRDTRVRQLAEVLFQMLK